MWGGLLVFVGVCYCLWSSVVPRLWSWQRLCSMENLLNLTSYIRLVTVESWALLVRNSARQTNMKNMTVIAPSIPYVGTMNLLVTKLVEW